MILFGTEINKTREEIVTKIVNHYTSFGYSDLEVRHFKWLLNNMSIGELLDEYIKWVR